VTPIEKIQAIYEDLNNRVVGQRELVRILCEALICGEHVFLLGTPGIGKTYAAAMLGEYIDGTVFKWQFNRFTTPDEVFGPRSLLAMKKDEYARNPTGRAAEATLFIADEFGKANTAISNSVLEMMQERTFEGSPTPLRVMLATSNEYLAGTTGNASSGDSLEATWDRFAYRYEVDGNPSDSDLWDIIMLDDPGKDPAIEPLTADDLKWFDRQIKKMRPSGDHREFLTDLRADLAAQSIGPSPRRWKKVMRKLAQARALLRGRTEVLQSDFSVLEHAAWSSPKQREALQGILRDKLSPGLRRAMEMMDEVLELCSEAQNATDVSLPSATTEFKRSIGPILMEIKGMLGDDLGDEVREHLVEVRKRISAADKKLTMRMAELMGEELDEMAGMMSSAPSPNKKRAGFLSGR
jgi:MoxR-like ATPase